MNVLDEPTVAADLAAAPDSTVPTGAPIAPANLLLLFTRPGEFFAKNLDFEHTGSLVTAALIVGISSALSRIESRDTPMFDDANWVTFWLTLGIIGLFNAGFVFFVGGWWYRKRIGFCGDEYADADEARQIYTYISLVEALPGVLLMLMVMPFYASYAEYSGSDNPIGLATVPFFFLSCLASYRGVTARFAVEKGKALFWFLLLPVAFAGAALLLVGGLLWNKL